MPCAMTKTLRSLASLVITSWARASASPPRRARCGGPVDEWHHRNGGAARRAGDDPVGGSPASRQRQSDGSATAASGAEGACVLWRTATRRGSARCRALPPRIAGSSPPGAPRPRVSGRCRPSAVSRSLVDALIEWSKLEPLLQIAEYLVSGDAFRPDAPAAAAWQPRKRRRWAMSQPWNCGLRSISSPSRKSPANNAAQISQPLRRERLDALLDHAGISIASTEQSVRSSATVSPLGLRPFAGRARRACRGPC